MHLKGLNLNLLVVLDALLSEKSTTRAGHRIYLSQSATSGALAQLREFFSDELLVPSGRKMILTPLAETLVAPVREIIETAEGLVEKTVSFDPFNSTRTFILNMSDATATFLLNRALPKIKELAPRVRFEVVTYNEKVPEIIEQGEVDFIEVPDLLASPFHPSELLFEDEYVCIAWAGNRALQDELSLEQFLSLGHVTIRFLRKRDHLGDILLRDSGAKPRYDLVVPVFSMMPHTIIGTDLIGLINKRFASHYAQFLPLKIFPSPIKLEPLKMLLQWNRLRDQDGGTRWLRQVLVGTLHST